MKLEICRVVSKNTSLSINKLMDKVRNPISLVSLTKLALSSETKVPEKKEYDFLLCYVT